MNLARLLARLAINQRSGLARKQDDAISAAVQAELQYKQAGEYGPPSSSVFEVLLSGDPDRKILRLIGEALEKLKIQSLSLVRTQVSNLEPLANLRALEYLDLSDTPVLDLEPLANLRALEHLDLSSAPVSERMVSALQESLPGCNILF